MADISKIKLPGDNIEYTIKDSGAARSSHSHTKSEITDFSHNHDERYYTEDEIDSKLNSKLNSSLKGVNNGIAELDSTGKVPSSQLPSYVDDVLEFNSQSNFPSTGETGKIYIAKDTNKTYRWSGTNYVEISTSLALGETSSTAYRGDRGKIAYDHSQTSHAPSNAEVNQNAFSNVKVGSTTVAADSKTDTLEFVAGTNVTLTSDATNDKVTITAKDTTYSAATTSAAGLMSATDKTKLDGIATGANKTTVDSALSSTSTNPVQNKVVNTAISNLNTLVGDTAVSTQITNAIDEITPASIGAATSSHTHNYAGSSSAGGAANSVANSMTVQLNSGTTEGTNKFTFNGSAAKSVNITPSTIGAAASSHGTHVSYSSTNPVMDGTASVGSASTVARSDHKHPTDTTRAAASDLTSHTGDKSNPHGVTLSQLGVTATATELNYCDGVTSNIQTQLNNTVKLSGNQTVSGNKTFNGAIILDDPDANITPSLYTDYTDALKINVGGNLCWIDPNGHFGSSVDGRLIGANTLSTYGVTGVKGNAESSYRKGEVNITPANLGIPNARNITISTADPTSSDGGNGDVWITYGNAQSDCPFPVGGIYISIASTDPSSIWSGTTWEQFAKGRTLVGLDTSDSNFTTIGQTGGEKTHTLTPTEIPAHGHGMAHTHSYTGPNTGSWKVGTGKAHTWCTSAGGKTSGAASKTTTDNAGGGGSHNNLQPYIVVYMWKRVS